MPNPSSPIQSITLEMVIADYRTGEYIVSDRPVAQSIELTLVTPPGGLYQPVSDDKLQEVIRQIFESGERFKVTIERQAGGRREGES